MCPVTLTADLKQVDANWAILNMETKKILSYLFFSAFSCLLALAFRFGGCFPAQ